MRIAHINTHSARWTPMGWWEIEDALAHDLRAQEAAGRARRQQSHVAGLRSSIRHADEGLAELSSEMDRLERTPRVSHAIQRTLDAADADVIGVPDYTPGDYRALQEEYWRESDARHESAIALEDAEARTVDVPRHRFDAVYGEDVLASADRSRDGYLTPDGAVWGDAATAERRLHALAGRALLARNRCAVVGSTDLEITIRMPSGEHKAAPRAECERATGQWNGGDETDRWLAAFYAAVLDVADDPQD